VKRLSTLVIACGLCALAYGFSGTAASAADPKNLKVYPAGTSKKVIKKDMKAISKALGVQCDHCHDMDDMAKDSPKKEEARKMMRMVQSLNSKELKKYDKVSCKTCHRGQTEPPR
jgi:hypothetical protein